MGGEGRGRLFEDQGRGVSCRDFHISKACVYILMKISDTAGLFSFKFRFSGETETRQLARNKCEYCKKKKEKK